MQLLNYYIHLFHLLLKKFIKQFMEKINQSLFLLGQKLRILI